ncbi:hypothetical protein DL96DRAFT_1463063 [Flagelloscypha sp. PMI_526]|nr:hypothetical protein DL96DRAFT_1463063 [Flagelloscypha sp. PMI_526]
MATENSVDPPSSYTVGGKETSPFVSPPQLKGHLALLNEFAALHTRVTSLTQDELENYKGLPNIVDQVSSATSQQRWVCFVELAVERFEAWCLTLKQEDVDSFNEDSLPPIDVLMVWHSYMLNPGNYAEDCLRLPMCKFLRQLSPMFSKMLPRLPEILNQTVSSSRKDNWDGRCDPWSFDPIVSAKEAQFKTFLCPKPGCSNAITYEYVRLDGTGILQQRFCVQCPNCHRTVNKGTFTLRRLADDLCRDTTDVSQYLAGSLVTMRNICDRSRGERIKSILKDVLLKRGSAPEGSIEYALTVNARDLGTVSTWVAKSYKNEPGVLKMLNHVLDSYKCHKPFSTDLAAAVLRQFEFATKMKSLPWGSGFKSSEEERPLIHAIARYHSFLDLMAGRLGFYVPTLDIDLAWHTHQLSGVQYERDCFEYVGKFVNHDDKVDGLQLGDGFNDTCKAWQHRYGVRYAYCGCPIPDAKSVGQRLSRILNKPLTPLHLTDHAPPINDASAECTHPSVHSVLTPDEYGKKTARLSKDMRKRSAAERNEVWKLSDTTSDEAKMARTSSHKWAYGHQSYLQEVPLYFETPVAGCRSFSHPYKVSLHLRMLCQDITNCRA